MGRLENYVTLETKLGFGPTILISSTCELREGSRYGGSRVVFLTEQESEWLDKGGEVYFVGKKLSRIKPRTFWRKVIKTEGYIKALVPTNFIIEALHNIQFQ